MRYLISVLSLSFLMVQSITSAAVNNSPAKPTPSAPAALSGSRAANAGMDSNRVHTLYQDGDFDQAINLINAAVANGKIRSHSDSVFVFKHLGVMYAAKESTRERGKYYMMQLLTIEPTARIMDMYASDMIYMIFRNIQEEVEVAQTKYKRAQGHVEGNQAQAGTPGDAPDARPANAAQSSPPANTRDRGEKKSYAWVAWTGALVVAVGAGVAVYMVNASDSPSVKNQQVQ